MNSTIAAIAATEERIVKVWGGCRTGKTEAIVARVAHLVEGGCAPGDILVEATTAMACQELHERIAKA